MRYRYLLQTIRPLIFLVAVYTAVHETGSPEDSTPLGSSREAQRGSHAPQPAQALTLTRSKMEHDNKNNFSQNIDSNGTGHQNYVSGRGHQIINGSGTTNIYNGAYPNSNNSRQKIIRALDKSPYKERKDRNPERIPGTCEWFMHHDNFHHWRDSISSSVLWVSANPGCGKSVLARYLVDELKSTEQRTTCYFFFKDDFVDQRSAKGALSCILHQLFLKREHLFSAKIMKRFKSYKAPSDDSYYGLSALWDILTMVTRENKAGEIICILDAFDECESQERQELAKMLREFYGSGSDAKKSVNLKFLITSRPYDAIHRDLVRPFDIQDCPVIHLKGEGDAEVKKIAEEIGLYIKHKVSRIRADPGLTQEEENILLQGLGAIPNQTYLWVYLTLEWIENEIKYKISEPEIRNAISVLPRTVDEAYDKILAKSTDVEETKKLLHIVVAAERPLTLAEMELALAIRQHHKSYKDLPLRPTDRVNKYIRDLCGLFINIIDEKIYLLHQTAKEFLVPSNNPYSHEYSPAQREDVFREDHRNGLSWKSSLIPSESHRILCKICIWHLLFMEFETRRLARATQVANYLRNHLFLGYSAKNWATHFRASNITEKEVLQQLQRLCNATSDHCPAWFEIYWADIHNDFPLEFTTLMIASYFGLQEILRLQLETAGVEIDSTDGSHRRTALSFASENGFDGVVQLLIKGPKFNVKRGLKNAFLLAFSKGANVNAIDRYSRTALFYAAWNGHLSIVKRLLEARARVDMSDAIDGTPLSYALCYGQDDIATELIKGAQPDSVDEIRRELLSSAVEYGHDQVVKRLLDSGADPGAMNSRGVSLLTLAIEYRRTNITKLLIEKGADIHQADWDSFTPLTWAIYWEETSIIELLIKRGADINQPGYNSFTPLTWAAKQGKTNMIELLIEKGADINQPDRNSFTPLTWAAKQGKPNMIELLIEKGADINQPDCDSFTPLIWAIEQGETNIVELLIEKGADINKSDHKGTTPLIFAIDNRWPGFRPQLVEMILKRGTRVDYTFERSAEKGFSTPLLHAIKRSEYKIVDLLLRYGADPNFQGTCESTPLEVAEHKRDKRRTENLARKGVTNLLQYKKSDMIVHMLKEAIKLGVKSSGTV